jgi:hypothetical protein
MITLAAIYDDGSEALHGTIYGCTFHFGAYRPESKIERPEDMSKHYRDNLAMAFFLFGMLLGRINAFIGDKLGLEDIKSLAKDTNGQILDTLNRCLNKK